MSSIDSVAQKYRGLYLSAIAQGLEKLLGQAEANAVSYLHFAETLIELELQQRNGKRIEQNQRRAGFPVHKSLDEFDYVFQTSISKREVNSLLDFGFIDNRENVVFIGSPERLSAAMVTQDPAQSVMALAHYAVLNGQLTGQGENHVVH